MGNLRQRAAQRAGNNSNGTGGGNAVAVPDQTYTPEQTGEVRENVKTLIESMGPEIARSLPKHLNVERMTRVALTVLRANQDLQKCSPASFIGALLTCSQLGVEPGPLGHAYIVPFWNRHLKTFEATFILGYKGMIDMARRSDRLKSISAHTIFQREVDEGLFKVSYGSEQHIEHTPIIFGDRGQPVGYYAHATLDSGEHVFAVLSVADVEEFRKRSQTQKAERPSGPWQTDYQAMAWKTCVRRLATWLPQSVEFAAALGNEDTVRNVSTGSQAYNVLDAPAPDHDDDGYEVIEGQVDESTGEITDGTEAPAPATTRTQTSEYAPAPTDYDPADDPWADQ